MKAKQAPGSPALPLFQAGTVDLPYEIRLKTYRVTAPVAPYLREGQPLELSSPQAAEVIARSIWAERLDQHRESVLVLGVDARNRATAAQAWTGSVDHSVVYPRSILELCIRAGCSGFILFHNHPSGDTQPSAQDMNLTKSLEIAARCLGVRFLDHMILNLSQPGDHFSFNQSGLIGGAL